MSARLRLRAATTVLRSDPVPAALLVSAVGWVSAAWLVLVGDAASVGHGHTAVGAVTDAATLAATTATPEHGLALWLLMVLAMAPLLLVREAGRLWRGSLRRSRWPVLLVFAGGYAVPWVAAGIVAAPLAEAILSSRNPVPPVLVAVLAVAVWHCSPARGRLLNVCHREPSLRVFGGAAIRDALRYGLSTGAACAASCGPLMLLVLLAGGFHLVAMVAATALLVAERYGPVRRPQWRIPFVPVKTSELSDAVGRR